MRPLLLTMFGGLIFLLTLILAQEVFGLDSPQMRWVLLPLLGWDAEQRYAPGVSLRDWLAYLLAGGATGVLLYRLGRLMYRREG